MKDLVVGIGEALWDVLPDGKKLGGAPANFAYHVSQFGFDSCVISAIGTDDLGDEIIRQMEQRQLGHCIARVGFPTGTVEVSLDAKGIPNYDIREGVAWDNIPFSTEIEEIAGKTTAVCFGSLAQRSSVSRDSIRRFLDAMPKGIETLRVFDINLRQRFYSRDLIEESLRRSNILKINDEELVTVSDMFGLPYGTVESRCGMLLSMFGLKMLILTCGTDGSYVFTSGSISFQPTPKVKVADTVGAGDSFTGAFIASLLKGKYVQEAHRTAVEVSAFVCTCNGAMPQLPDGMTK